MRSAAFLPVLILATWPSLVAEVPSLRGFVKPWWIIDKPLTYTDSTAINGYNSLTVDQSEPKARLALPRMDGMLKHIAESPYFTNRESPYLYLLELKAREALLYLGDKRELLSRLERDAPPGTDENGKRALAVQRAALIYLTDDTGEALSLGTRALSEAGVPQEYAALVLAEALGGMGRLTEQLDVLTAARDQARNEDLAKLPERQARQCRTTMDNHKKLRAMGEELFGPLVSSPKWSSFDSRRRLLRTLVTKKKEILALLDHPELEMRQTAIMALEELRPYSCVGPLWEKFVSNSEASAYSRNMALGALARIGGRRAHALFLAGLKDKRHNVARLSAEGLCALNGPNLVLEAIPYVLRSADTHVRSVLCDKLAPKQAYLEGSFV